MDVEGLIADLALILVLGALSTLIFKKLKQPVVLGYIVAGFIAGPHFSYFFTIHNEANIDFWAQIGIVVLLFSLGLEFSFKKLMNVGGSAIVTALIIVIGMMGLGFLAGRMLSFSNINSLFLGGMLSMSSTTIIIKAFNDLNMTHRRFVPHVFAVLICEDLFAVVMMVLLSSIAINNSVEGGEMLMSILKLVFFLVIWFTVGVFIIPTFFKRSRKLITDEILLVVAMGMCFLMAVFSVYSGFSLALGAFVMGSILAGTCEAEHIEHVIKPVKDLFGAIFFISVGMMVNPEIIVEYASTIIILSLVVIVGMIVFGTFGMLATGQSLKIAIESGFSLTQIGEFAFIIASLGLSLGVLDPTLYPIVVAVSVITTFFTPYFIKWAEPFYNKIEPHIPARLMYILNRYSKQESEVSEERKIWKAVIGRYAWRVILYSSLIIAIIIVSNQYLAPLMNKVIGKEWGNLITSVTTLAVMSPFLLALSLPSTKQNEVEALRKKSGSRSTMPLVVLVLFRIVLTFGFVTWYLGKKFSLATGVIVGLAVVIILVIFLSNKVRKHMREIESRFMRNLNERELRRSGHDSNLVSDLHVAYIRVGYTCPFVGEKLRNADIRKTYGINVVNIQRGSQTFPIPNGEMRIFPGDMLGIIGNDEQIQRILPIIEDDSAAAQKAPAEDEAEVRFIPIELGENSELIGKTSATARLRDDYQSLLVAIQRGENEYIRPTGKEVFMLHDILWIVGNVKKLSALKSPETK